MDLERGILWVRQSRRRPKYAHGCEDTWGKKAGYCPEKVRTNPDVDKTKSRAGRRTIGLPDQLVTLLRAHKEEQDAEREKARQLWSDEGWVFTKPDGTALNPNTDYHQWKALLEAAGIRDGRLHDARHTAATVLLILEVPERTVMSIMGWSSTAMARRYQHVTDTLRSGVAKRVDALLWNAGGGADAEAGMPSAKGN
ncbi:tyrosine-type recombinase/integrase [Bailinhaonella thermotolerans]|uniref:tyrosine-type recombinase/integrase n=1 Tax=Bailinhaonella thermotolerans TaxID=1070861 RepID=UPI001F5B9363